MTEPRYPWQPSPALTGLTVIDSPYLDADRAFRTPGLLVRGTRTDSPGYEARCIVREGLADVLAWLRSRAAAGGEDTPGQPDDRNEDKR